jgi:hypothetical protein
VALDVTAAYAVPLGNVWGASSWSQPVAMSVAWTGAIPLEVAARYRFTPALSAGVYFQWGPAFAKSPGIDGFPSTSGSEMRLGVELVYELGPTGALHPWFLVGTGWEWTRSASDTASMTASGWEFLNLQVGLDLGLSKTFDLGPYVGFLGGNYTNVASAGTWQGWGFAVPPGERAFHGWFLLGIRGTATF